MKVSRQVSANARRRHLKMQHHKRNSRRQLYFNLNLVKKNQADPIQVNSM